MCRQAPSREVLATWVYCWSEQEGEGDGSAHWHPPGLQGGSQPALRCMLIRNRTLSQQHAKCAIKPLSGKNWEICAFACSHYAEPRGHSLCKRLYVHQLRTASMFTYYVCLLCFSPVGLVNTSPIGYQSQAVGGKTHPSGSSCRSWGIKHVYPPSREVLGTWFYCWSEPLWFLLQWLFPLIC